MSNLQRDPNNANNGTEDIALPKYWEKWILASYLIMMGESWECAGKAVGRSRRTIGYWIESRDLWAMAKVQAEDRWFNDLKDASRKAVLQQIKNGDGNMGLNILERVDERLRPAPVSVSVELPVSPIERLTDKLEAMNERRLNGAGTVVTGRAASDS